MGTRPGLTYGAQGVDVRGQRARRAARSDGDEPGAVGPALRTRSMGLPARRVAAAAHAAQKPHRRTAAAPLDAKTRLIGDWRQRGAAGRSHIESLNGRFRDECRNEHWFESLHLGQDRDCLSGPTTTGSPTRQHLADTTGPFRRAASPACQRRCSAPHPWEPMVRMAPTNSGTTGSADNDSAALRSKLTIRHHQSGFERHA